MPGAREGRPPDSEQRGSDGNGSLRWAYLASAIVVLVAALVGITAFFLTPGEPNCRVPAVFVRPLLCPWYRAFAWNAAVVFSALLVVMVFVSVTVSVGRALIRRNP